MLDPIFNSAIMNNLLELPWFQFVFIVIITIFAAIKVTLQSAACRKHIRNSRDSLMYNAMFFTAIAIFLSLTLKMQIPTAEILVWTAIMAIGTVLFQVSYSVALTEGPVSITVLIINFAVVIPTVVSAVVFREDLFISQVLGVICLLIPFPLSMKEGSHNQKKASKKWLLLTVAALIADSGVMTLQKLFRLTDSYNKAPEPASNTFLLFVYIFSIILALAVYFVKGKISPDEKRTFRFGKSVILFATAMGLDLAIFQKVYMTANMRIPGSFFFPTFSGMSSVLMTVIGILLFGDRLNKRQWLGVIFGIAAVVLLNIQFGMSFKII